MRKDTFIILRVSKEMKTKLEKLAGGGRKLSEFIRNLLEKTITKKTD